MKFILITFEFISVILNLSQSPSNLSQSSSIYLSHPQFISVTFKYISVILNLSQSSSIYLSHPHFISVIFNLSQSCSSQAMKWLKTAHTYHKLIQIDFKVISKCSYTILSDPKPPIYHCDSLTVIFSHFQFFSVIHMTEIN